MGAEPLIRDILKRAAERVGAPSMTAGQVASTTGALQPVVPPAMSVADALLPEPDISAAEILLNELASPITSGGV